MANIHKFTENVRSRYGAFSSDLGAETSPDDTVISAEYVNMANYDMVVGVAIASGVASGVIITLAMWQATASTGSGSKTVSGASDTFAAATETETDILVAQVRGEDLDVDNGFQYVGFKISTDGNGTEKVAGVLHQLRARYKQASLPA